MNEREEKLQHDIEAGKKFGGEDVHAEAYRHVFRALEKEPGFSLPDSFSEGVIQKLPSRTASSFRDYFWLSLGIFSSIIALVVAVVMTDFKMDLGFLKGMSAYKGLFIFAIGSMVVFNLFEKRLLKSKGA